MAEGAKIRGFMAPLLVVNFVMFVFVLGLAGWSIDKFIDREYHRHYRGSTSIGFLLTFSLMAGAVGSCSMLAGFMHLKAWRSESLASAMSSGLVSWALTILSFGLTCKQATLRNRSKRLRAMETFIAILTFTQLLYLLLLYAGIMNSKYGPGYHGYDTDYGMMSNELKERKSKPPTTV